MKKIQRLLLVRGDRIGDVILSTPAFRAAREAFPQARIAVAVQPLVAPLLNGLKFIDEVIEIDPSDSSGMRKAWAMFQPDAAVVFQSQRKIAWSLFLAGIPLRIGPKSKFHSFLLYNNGLWQRRSQVLKHEAEYNLDLIEHLVVVGEGRLFDSKGSRKTEIAVDANAQQEAVRWLEGKGFSSNERWVLVHPGMGGSAKNWPEERYRELVKHLRKRGIPVLVSRGPMDSFRIEDYSDAVVYDSFSERRDLKFFAALVSMAHTVVAPSTGPLHMAVALGKPVITFFPLKRVQSKERWGPFREKNAVGTAIFEPLDESEESMGRIPVEKVLKQVLDFYEASKGEKIAK